MNLNKVFALLASKQINEAECRFASSTALSFSTFRGAIANYTTHTSNHLGIDAIIDHKLVISYTEDLTNSGINTLIDNLITTAPYIEKTGGMIFHGASKYKKFTNFNKELATISVQEKQNLILNIEKALKAYDTRFGEVEVEYAEYEDIHEYRNSYGVKLKNKSNSFSIFASVVAKEGKITKVGYLPYIGNDYHKFNLTAFVEELAQLTLKKLNVTQLTSKKYRVVFDPEVTTTLLGAYISQLNAEEILKGSSWFKDKINTQVANKRVTIVETPLKRDFDFVGADAQGVPTMNRPLIKKGVLLTYLHNLETAQKFGVEPTGHAVATASKISIHPHDALHLKPGRLTKEELLAQVGDGIYITELEGLHAGLDALSGNISLKAEGFVIQDGKLTTALDMMTVTANLFDIFARIKKISQNIEYVKEGFMAPCIYLDKIAISF
ncbi:MAG: TldD/PmbA family protein [Bacilli bacterium]|nr:TldD/PmbA family protein [Bacilli bacterium]